MLLTTAFFPPVSWFAAAASDCGGSFCHVTLEACENYQKQSYRNRCRILSAGGVEDLSVPVVHEGGTFRLPIREIKVDYSVPWPAKFKRAISSAYYSSAFFEYYRDGLFAVLDSAPATLWDLNLGVIEFFFRKIGLGLDLSFTEEFHAETLQGDHRFDIHPKKPDTILRDLGLEKPYFQVFSEKYGFRENLSIMDLLFNEGPSSIEYIAK